MIVFNSMPDLQHEQPRSLMRELKDVARLQRSLAKTLRALVPLMSFVLTHAGFNAELHSVAVNHMASISAVRLLSTSPFFLSLVFRKIHIIISSDHFNTLSYVLQ